jgi:hypothetical protein
MWHSTTGRRATMSVRRSFGQIRDQGSLDARTQFSTIHSPPALDLTLLGRTHATTHSTTHETTLGWELTQCATLAPNRGQRFCAANLGAVSPSGRPLPGPAPPQAASPSGGDSSSSQHKVPSPSGADSLPGGAHALDPPPLIDTAIPDAANAVPLGADVVSPLLADITQVSELLETTLQDLPDAGISPGSHRWYPTFACTHDCGSP